MRRLLTIAIVCFCTASFAGEKIKSVVITGSGGSPIPTSYGTGSQSLVITGISPNAKNIQTVNEVASAFTMNCATAGTQAVPSTGDNDFQIGASQTQTWLNVGLGTKCYLRSASGSTVTANSIKISYW